MTEYMNWKKVCSKILKNERHKLKSSTITSVKTQYNVIYLNIRLYRTYKNAYKSI